MKRVAIRALLVALVLEARLEPADVLFVPMRYMYRSVTFKNS